MASREEITRLGGLARAASLTPKQRRKISRKGAKARWLKARIKAARLLGIPLGDLGGIA
jgi:hypothetical protein